MQLFLDVSGIDVSLTISIAAFAASIIALIITSFYQKKQDQKLQEQNDTLRVQNETLRTQNDLSGLVQVHELLSNDVSRESRWKIFRAYDAYQKSGNLSEFDPIRSDVTKVQADFDLVGAMVLAELVPRETFLDSYAAMVIRTWAALEDRIGAQRDDKQHGCRIMQSFQGLEVAAEEYWRRKYPGEPVPKPFFDPTLPSYRKIPEVVAVLDPIGILKVMRARGDITDVQYDELAKKLRES